MRKEYLVRSKEAAEDFEILGAKGEEFAGALRVTRGATKGRA